ncbi:sensor histidine kinase [Hydrocarboniclastica marina]|uniref:histidine kinase n=1 Tax=Hydrocarboniclastica marina TaxID=2259620 RepID=A0A4P7XE13_9ALTE|nr:ATP-binding protein [Hydrocarboniclastica marina]QCF25111.1 histidine kinase [Hydrocarboniclastica marina]
METKAHQPEPAPTVEIAPGQIQRHQKTRLFRVYNHYRLAISLVLVMLLIVDLEALQPQYRFPAFYQALVLGYFGLNAFIGFMLLAGFQPHSRHTTVSVLVDLLVLHGMLFFSSGITSALANLIIISVAAGNILNPTRLGFFFAALAAIGSLALAGWDAMVIGGGNTGDDIVRAGFLGILYFGVAFVLQNITRRLIFSEALASERAESIAALERLNHQIIQRMRTGIIVADPQGEVKLANEAAGELLLGERRASRDLERLPTPLQERLERWFAQPSHRTEPFQVDIASPMLQANFTRLEQESDDRLLIFLDDTSKITQQAQQLKLASLGRLTAGIAHEVRNPLGAISHAAQLLAESDALNGPDRKMLDIIQRHAARVNTIIENVLELSRRRQPDARVHDLYLWTLERVTHYQNDCDQHSDISLEPGSHRPQARFDSSQMEQVLTNLIDNGLRYSEQETGARALDMSIGMAEDGERAYLDIRDRGPGISESQRASIFEPFYTTERTGTGLGLYLARELCEANQAQLALIDAGPGGCFRITFAHPQRQSLNASL